MPDSNQRALAGRGWSYEHPPFLFDGQAGAAISRQAVHVADQRKIAVEGFEKKRLKARTPRVWIVAVRDHLGDVILFSVGIGMRPSAHVFTPPF
jgi:hypothetical protein